MRGWGNAEEKEPLEKGLKIMLHLATLNERVGIGERTIRKPLTQYQPDRPVRLSAIPFFSICISIYLLLFVI
jgi:hypothetical protein